MSSLKLQRRDDPLTLSTTPPADPKPATEVGPDRLPEGVVARAMHQNGETASEPGTVAPPTPSQTGARTVSPEALAPAGVLSYEGARLEQSGWRLYEPLLERVREHVQELKAAGVECSAAALAAATLHSHLPRNVEEGEQLMRAYRQATASRRPRSNREQI